MLRLCITSDDFGADIAVNAAVEAAHRDGVLTAASLMVTGAAADDAVARARALPGLGVGLHLVLVDGTPALAPERLPDLVGDDGRFRTDMVATSFGMLRPRVRAQLAAEITAQFEAFAGTGLTLDHANAHKHFHLHPIIGGLLASIGKRFGLKAIRAPVEPAAVLRQVEPVRVDLAGRVAGIWARRARRRFVAAGFAVPDSVFGLTWSGAMTARRVAALVAALPAGSHEIYAHPATADTYPGSAPGYRYRDELAALVDPAVRAAVTARGARLGSFARFGAAA
ncbi:PTS cellobiose transporter [alpha proteobacterium AAP81b]|nr:PTS cellobiose transporter [alpha proteobacterium AAP81b]